jgi:hypothetical protein
MPAAKDPDGFASVQQCLTFQRPVGAVAIEDSGSGLPDRSERRYGGALQSEMIHPSILAWVEEPNP